MAEIITYSNRDRIDADTIVVFDHIPKCAGTSFDAWLTNSCKGRKIHVHCHADYMDLLSREAYDFKLVSDHFTWGTHHFLPDSLCIAYVTMIRDPLKVAISLYNFSKNQLFGDYSKDINSYLLDYQPNMFTNHLGQGCLKSAKEKLFETYCVYGIVEHYQESVDIIASALKVTCGARAFEKRNVSKSVTHEISDSVREIFLEMNADDYDLYSTAVKELHLRNAGVAPAPASEPGSFGEGVVFTGTLPDVRSALDSEDYGQALALLGGKHLDSLPRNMMLFACLLAQKIGDTGQASALYEKMQNTFPHTYTDYFAEYLMSMGEHARAMELAEAELRLFEPLPSMPQDTRFFEYYVRFNCLVIKACHHAAPDRVDLFVGRLTTYSGKSEHAFVSLLNVLCEVGSYARAVDVYRSFAHVPRNNPVTVYTAMVSACYNGGLFEEAKTFCSRILSRAPYNHYAIKTLIVMDRRTARFEMDLEPYEELARRLEGTVLSTSILREIAMHHYENSNPGKAFGVVSRLPASAAGNLLEVACRNHAVVPFSDVSLRDVLVIRSGPNLVFDHVYAQLLKPGNQRFDAVGVSLEAIADKYALVDKGIVFPGTRYLHAEDFEDISRQLCGKTYKDCIVIMSDFDFLSYGEILKLASAVADGRIYVYSLSHLLSGKYVQTVLALSSEAGREAQ